MKEVIFEYDYRSDMLRLTSEAVEIFKVPEVIEHFSSYQSEILVVDGKGNNPLYEQLMKKSDFSRVFLMVSYIYQGDL